MANKLFLVILFFCLANQLSSSVATFYNNVDVTWGGGRGKILENGNLLVLTLDQGSGSGFQSKQQYLYGRIDMQIKVVPGNSAGTVSTYYLSSQGPLHDEIDFEFLGNSSGEPYTLHTNVFSQGKGSREQQFRLWFDPRLTYHTYSILWNPNNIIFYVDNVPIRVFRNLEAKMGIPYPRSQPMRLYSSLWSADDWATQGGRVKTDWSRAPFVTSYRNLITNACPVSGPRTACGGAWMATTLDAASQAKLRSVRQNNMIYDYCRDYSRFPNGFPPECSIQI